MTPAEAPSGEGVADAARRYGTIVVVGGGCYGAYYVRQLARARGHDALRFERVVVVDRDPACAVARSAPADVELSVAPWEDFFRDFLGGPARTGDAIVPSPLMPHLLVEWLLGRAHTRWPGRRVGLTPPGVIPGVPWQREGTDGSRYVSFAEWVCPVNCIEPRICPHTRGERTWSFPPALAGHVKAAQAAGGHLDGPAIFHCTHRSWGVGMIDVEAVLEADRVLERLASNRPVRLLVGTVSHCHGALSILSVE